MLKFDFLCIITHILFAFSVDKKGALCLNVTNHIERRRRKTCPFQVLIQRAGGWCEPEQTDWMIWFLSWSCKRQSVSNKTRLPPLLGRTLLEVRK